jgi:hypothetical protein
MIISVGITCTCLSPITIRHRIEAVFGAVIMVDIHLDWEVEKNYYEIIVLFIFRMASLIAPCSKFGLHLYIP